MTEKLAWRVALLSASVLCGPGVTDDARAQGAPAELHSGPQIAPSSSRGYWTKERMESARPMEKHPPADYRPPQQRPPRTEGRSIGEGESPPEQRRSR